MYGQNPYNQYKETAIQTATPEKLVLMLFDGGVKFIKQGKKHIENKEYQEANNKLQRAQAIVTELMNSLDHNTGEVADNLFRLYEYMNYQLIQGNIKKDTDKLDEVTNMMSNLKDTFREASKQMDKNKPQKEAVGIGGKA